MSGNSWKIIAAVLIVVLVGCTVHQSRSYGQPQPDTQPIQETRLTQPGEKPPPGRIMLVGKSWFDRGVAILTAVVLALTLIVICRYTTETRRLRKAAWAQYNVQNEQVQTQKETLTQLAGQTKILGQQVEAQTYQLQLQRDALKFSALSQVHSALAGQDSRDRRRHLHRHFETGLGCALHDLGDQEDGQWARNVTTKFSAEVSKVYLTKILEAKDVKAKPALVACLIDRLRAYTVLEAVEGTMADLRMIELPVWEGLEGALDIARAYRPVVERTAPLILPYVAIQIRLRGDGDYGRSYRFLLQELGIEVPKELKVEGPKRQTHQRGGES